MSVTHGQDNVLVDLGFDVEEAANLKIRADLMLDLRRYIQDRGWTQVEAAAFFGETQPRISNVMKGEINGLTVFLPRVMLRQPRRTHTDDRFSR